MSAQIVELIFFAVVAFVIVNKLISILGTTTDQDEKRAKSFFGEARMKDVTSTTPMGKDNVIEVDFNQIANQMTPDLSKLIVMENKESITSGLVEVVELLHSFNLDKFLRNAKMAFQMIIEAEVGSEDLVDLVDRRYIEKFQAAKQSYGHKVNEANLEAKISEVYTFGNNIFVKVLFFGMNAVEAISNFHEEWTFTKNAFAEGPEWHLTNVDKSN